MLQVRVERWVRPYVNQVISATAWERRQSELGLVLVVSYLLMKLTYSVTLPV